MKMHASHQQAGRKLSKLPGKLGEGTQKRTFSLKVVKPKNFICGTISSRRIENSKLRFLVNLTRFSFKKGIKHEPLELRDKQSKERQSHRN